MSFADLGRVLVVIPTYNEADNLEPVLVRLRGAVPEADVLVADDNSPDGTGAIADGLAAADGTCTCCTAPRRQGLGAAYIAGFGWALADGYDAVVEMDADGSHAPEELPRLLAALRDADLVIGSRWVPGGEVLNWPMPRLLLSRGGNLYTRVALRLAGARRHRRLPGLPAGRAGEDRRWTRSPPRATASRSTWPGGPGGPASGWSRCRSRSPSGRSGRAR